LAIAQRILEIHDRVIAVESDATGSTFRFALPAA
jgi:signal transduction histidine kinase